MKSRMKRRGRRGIRSGSRGISSRGISSSPKRSFISTKEADMAVGEKCKNVFLHFQISVCVTSTTVYQIYLYRHRYELVQLYSASFMRIVKR